MDFKQFETRKKDHIRLSLDDSNQATGSSGFDRFHLEHDALPEVDFSEVQTQIFSLGRKRSTPFYVCGMTAGHSEANQINQILAKACLAKGWAMGLGSQRRDLEQIQATGSGAGSSPGVDKWTEFKKEAVGLEVFSNLGLSQALDAKTADLQNLIETSGASALAIHLNSLQEVIQPEGTPQFKGGVETLQRLSNELGAPIILKETGCGFSKKTFSKIESLSLGAVDISGLGGTHWGRIEGDRSPEPSLNRSASETFANWGVPTVESLVNGKGHSNEIWASGGLRSGLDAAKAVALGATRVGFAKPALEFALRGEKELINWMTQIEFEFKVAMFCTGSSSVEALKKAEITGER